jgi:hypothetical protein
MTPELAALSVRRADEALALKQGTPPLGVELKLKTTPARRCRTTGTPTAV